MGSTPIAGYPTPDNGSNWSDLAANIAALGNAIERGTLNYFATAAARDTKITSSNARLGMFVWLDTPGNHFKLTAIAGTTLTWSEMGPVAWKCAQSYAVSNALNNGDEIGVGAPPTGSTFGTFGTGTNGPTVPAPGDYLVTMIVTCTYSGGVAIGSATFRSFAAVSVAGSLRGRLNFGVGENIIAVTCLVQGMTVGQEISGTIYQNSGATATGSVNWYVTRVSL